MKRNAMNGLWMCGILLGSSVMADEALIQQVAGNSAFARTLYASLAKSKGNIFFSPYSLSAALAMTYAGARGQTTAQMEKVLHFSAAQDQTHSAFRDLKKQLESSGNSSGVQLCIANALWGQSGIALSKSFLETTRTYYGEPLHEVNFYAQTERARQTINQWAAEQTRQKISDLLAPGVLNSLTRLVLTNAIYFKGDWAWAFQKAQTRSAAFQTESGSLVQVPFMNQTHELNYAETAIAQILELPYKGHQLSMILVLPKKEAPLSEVENAFTHGTIEKSLQTLSPFEVRVSVPRFRLSQSLELAHTLASLGMPSVFSPSEADLSGINGQRDLFISKVIHKALIDVTEEGTEAAAATAVIVELRGMRSPSTSFIADHPFLYFLKDNATGSLLFVGRVVNPQ